MVMKKLLLLFFLFALSATAGIRSPFYPMGGRSGGLPGGGRAVEYLQADGKSYIDTGIVVSFPFRIVIDCTATDTYDYSIFGYNDNTTGTWIGSQISAYTTFRSSYKQNAIISSIYTYDSMRHQLDATWDDGASSLVVDGLTQTSTATSTVADYVGTSYLFARHQSNQAVAISKSGFRLHSCKLYADIVLVRDYVPAVVRGVPALYDRVSKTYFYNAGTGAFTAGPFIH